MEQVIKLAKDYVSTGSFLLLAALIYIFSDSSDYVSRTLDYVLPENGRFLAFLTCLGLILIHESTRISKKLRIKGYEDIKLHIKELQILVEKSSLVSDVNSAFSEFQASGKEFITGEYYIKEIHTLNDIREKLQVNSYTQNKLEYLMSKIKY